MIGWATRTPVASGAADLPRATETGRMTADDWPERIDELLAIRQLEDDWDGQGTPAPMTDVVDSALILALLLRREGIAAPDAVTQGLSGGVHFDWQPPDGRYIELQVMAPNTAAVYVHTPAAPTRRYALAGSTGPTRQRECRPAANGLTDRHPNRGEA